MAADAGRWGENHIEERVHDTSIGPMITLTEDGIPQLVSYAGNEYDFNFVPDSTTLYIARLHNGIVHYNGLVLTYIPNFEEEKKQNLEARMLKFGNSIWLRVKVTRGEEVHEDNLPLCTYIQNTNAYLALGKRSVGSEFPSIHRITIIETLKQLRLGIPEVDVPKLVDYFTMNSPVTSMRGVTKYEVLGVVDEA